MADAPQRIRLSRARGFDLQAVSRALNGRGAVNVARPSRLGNPFVVGRHGSRADCVRLYICACDGFFILGKGPSKVDIQGACDALVSRREKLRGKNIACWCALPTTSAPDICHGAVIRAIANDDMLALDAIIRAVSPLSTTENGAAG